MKIQHLLLIGGLAMAVTTLTGCSKKDDPVPEPTSSTPTPSNPNYIYYYSATIDGKSVEVGQKKIALDGYGNGMQESGEGNADTNYQYVMSTYFTNIKDTTKPVYAVGFVNTYPGYWGPPDYKTRAASIKIGSLSYGSDDPNIVKDGAFIEYWDANKTYWNTTMGSGNQSGSTFKVTDIYDNTDQTSYKIVEAEFSCTLYNKSGSSIKLKNGKVKGRLVTF